MVALEKLEPWLTQLRRFWFARVDALDRCLNRERDRSQDRMDQSKQSNGKPKRR